MFITKLITLFDSETNKAIEILKIASTNFTVLKSKHFTLGGLLFFVHYHVAFSFRYLYISCNFVVK